MEIPRRTNWGGTCDVNARCACTPRSQFTRVTQAESKSAKSRSYLPRAKQSVRRDANRVENTKPPKPTVTMKQRIVPVFLQVLRLISYACNLTCKDHRVT
eukprot:4463547-Amphidinium_carterae.1